MPLKSLNINEWEKTSCDRGTYAQFIVRGMILLGAVAFDEFQRNAKKMTRVR